MYSLYKVSESLNGFYLDVRLDKLLYKQSSGQWNDTPIWRHNNGQKQDLSFIRYEWTNRIHQDIFRYLQTAAELCRAEDSELTHWDRDKMLTFLRTPFWSHFLVWNLLYLGSNFTEFHSHWSNKYQIITGSDDGLPPNRRQVIIWSIAGPVHLTHTCVTRPQWVHAKRCAIASLLTETNECLINTFGGILHTDTTPLILC